MPARLLAKHLIQRCPGRGQLCLLSLVRDVAILRHCSLATRPRRVWNLRVPPPDTGAPHCRSGPLAASGLLRGAKKRRVPAQGRLHGRTDGQTEVGAWGIGA